MPTLCFKSKNLYAEGWGGCQSHGAQPCSRVPKRAISVIAHSTVELWYEWSAAVCPSCKCGAQRAAEMLQCNYVDSLSDPLAWNGSAAPIQSVGCHVFSQGGGSEVIWKDLLCTHCAHCLCKPVISGGIKLRHTTDENFRDFTVTGGGYILNWASVHINQIKFEEKELISLRDRGLSKQQICLKVNHLEFFIKKGTITLWQLCHYCYDIVSDHLNDLLAYMKYLFSSCRNSLWGE